jgi:hypothetical protein
MQLCYGYLLNTFHFRLLTQLRDLEEMKADLEEDEYEQLRRETLDQLREFEESLARSLGASNDANDPFLDDVERARSAVQETIRSAVASSGAKDRFAKKESAALRARLASLQESVRLGALAPEVFDAERRAVLAALQAMGEPLTDADREYLTGVCFDCFPFAFKGLFALTILKNI